jgi:hypothetical protein
VDPSPVVQWIGWHLAELVGVLVPGVLAVTLSLWWVVLSVVIAAGWLTHEVGLHRRRRALAAARPRQAMTGPPSTQRSGKASA